MKIQIVLLSMLILMALSCKNLTKNSSIQENGLDKIMKDYELMGLSLIVLKGEETVIEEYRGFRNIQDSLKVDHLTKYRIASISKSFVALAVMKLWQEGRIDLDQDVSDILGWEVQNPMFPMRNISLRNLMSHTSSVRDGMNYGKYLEELWENEISIKEYFTPQGSYYDDSHFGGAAPGSYFEYSNASWGLIATIIEMVTQKRFDAYMREDIFTPLGMTADFDVMALEDINPLSVLYRAKGEQWISQKDDYSVHEPKSQVFSDYEPGFNGTMMSPQGGLRASARDLIPFTQLLINGGKMNDMTFLSREVYDEMISSQWEYDGKNGNTQDSFFTSYGMGIHRLHRAHGQKVLSNCESMIGHAGIAYGLLSDMYVHPESKTAVILIINGSKRPYELSKESSFYQVEEAVFEWVDAMLESVDR